MILEVPEPCKFKCFLKKCFFIYKIFVKLQIFQLFSFKISQLWTPGISKNKLHISFIRREKNHGTITI